MRSALSGHVRGVRSGSCGLPWWPCAHGSRGGVCEPGSKADRCVSSLRSPHCIYGQGAESPPGVKSRSPVIRRDRAASQTHWPVFSPLFAPSCNIYVKIRGLRRCRVTKTGGIVTERACGPVDFSRKMSGDQAPVNCYASGSCRGHIDHRKMHRSSKRRRGRRIKGGGPPRVAVPCRTAKTWVRAR